MPAAAVIPAPIAYIKVVAVKKLVVEFWDLIGGLPNGTLFRLGPSFLEALIGLTACLGWSRTFTLKKLECSKQAYA